MNSSDFRISVNGRPFRVKVDRPFHSSGNDYCPVDVTDTRTKISAQALIEENITENPWKLTKESQFRDALKSAYGNALNYETSEWGKLPDDFTVSFRGTIIAVYFRTLNDTDGNPRRGWDVSVIDHDRSVMYLGFVDEEYGGNGTRSHLFLKFPDAVEIGWHEIQPKLYNYLMKKEIT
jgi:hypothetical protein